MYPHVKFHKSPINPNIEFNKSNPYNKNMLEEYKASIEHIETEIKCLENSRDYLIGRIAIIQDSRALQKEIPSYSEEATLKILKELDCPDGVGTRDVMSKYREKGIPTRYQQITKHFRHLLAKNHIFKVKGRYKAYPQENSQKAVK